MKLAILSMQRVVNSGSVLQAYSLREMIREVTGEEAVFMDIDSVRTLPSKKTEKESADYETPAAYPPGSIQKIKRRIITWLSACNKYQIRLFMKKELGLEKQAKSPLDFVIIGSDEVFNHAKGLNLQLHGDVPQAKYVISYAASCGSAVAEDVYPEHMERVQTALKRFRAISVRDSVTEQYIATLGGPETCRHLDPVLVGGLCKREHRSVWLKNYVLVYAYGQRIRSKEEIAAIQSFAKERGLKTVAVGGSQFWCDLYLPTHPFRLMDYFFYADYIVTDTFHGCVFSIINGGRFAVLARKTNRGKIQSLLEDLELSGRLVSDVSHLESVLTEKIDYDYVNKILERERKRSRDYLCEQLRG